MHQNEYLWSKGLKPIITQCRILTHLRYIAVENIVRKGEIACNKQLSPFLAIFSTLYVTYFPYEMYFKMSSAICFNLDKSKILSSGNGLLVKASSILKSILVKYALSAFQVFFSQNNLDSCTVYP